MVTRASLVNTQHNSAHGAINFGLNVPYANRAEFSRMHHVGIFDYFAVDFFMYEPNIQRRSSSNEAEDGCGDLSQGRHQRTTGFGYTYKYAGHANFTRSSHTAHVEVLLRHVCLGTSQVANAKLR
jgi:hypothetical protein